MTTMTARSCCHCGKARPIKSFQQFNGHPSGWCRECRTQKERERRAARGVPVKKLSRIDGGNKLCMACEEMVSLAYFSPSRRGLGGVGAYCRSCVSTRYSKTPASARATERYRTLNRARWLGLHRLHQFKRRMAMVATSDGTVTDEFLAALYARTVCAYCDEDVEADDRTADHVIPLSRGGAHSASNLVVACFMCNSTKSDRTDIEFIGRSIL